MKPQKYSLVFYADDTVFFENFRENKLVRLHRIPVDFATLPHLVCKVNYGYG